LLLPSGIQPVASCCLRSRHSRIFGVFPSTFPCSGFFLAHLSLVSQRKPCATLAPRVPLSWPLGAVAPGRSTPPISRHVPFSDPRIPRLSIRMQQRFDAFSTASSLCGFCSHGPLLQPSSRSQPAPPGDDLNFPYRDVLSTIYLFRPARLPDVLKLSWTPERSFVVSARVSF